MEFVADPSSRPWSALLAAHARAHPLTAPGFAIPMTLDTTLG